MEIYIQLAGVKLGPYSAEYVRRSLVENHLKPSDLARLNEADDWATVEQVLAQLPSLAPSPPSPVPLKAIVITSATSPGVLRPPIVAPTSPEPRSLAPPLGTSSKNRQATNRIFSPQTIAETGKSSPPQKTPLAKKAEIPQKATLTPTIRAPVPSPTIVANSAKPRPKRILRWGIPAGAGLALLVFGYAGFSYWNFSSPAKISSSLHREKSSSDSVIPDAKTKPQVVPTSTDSLN